MQTGIVVVLTISLFRLRRRHVLPLLDRDRRPRACGRIRLTEVFNQKVVTLQ